MLGSWTFGNVSLVQMCVRIVPCGMC